jgi:hypothetical protein
MVQLSEFREVGDSEEELADPIQQGFLLLFPFYNPDTINLHVGHYLGKIPAVYGLKFFIVILLVFP